MYYPKNKIQTNLFTSGGEFMFPSDRKEYQGKYWTTYLGETFSGEGPDDSTSQTLIPIQSFPLSEAASSKTSKIAFFTNDPDPVLNPDRYSQREVVVYNILSGGDGNNENPLILPTYYYPQITEDEYTIGEFTRYFVKKSNEIKFIEIDKKQYDKFNERSPNYAWEMYIPFTLLWKISGNHTSVFNTNKSITELRENKFQLYGLSSYLKNDYLNFYRYKEQNNLYTSGNLLLNTNGTEYTGPYHIHSELGPMVGKVHTDEPHSRLLWQDLSSTKPKTKNKYPRPFQSRRSGGSSSY